MSAFVVGKEHIDALVALAIRGPREEVEIRPDRMWYGVQWVRKPELNWSDADHSRKAEHSNADEIGAMLWGENVRSIHSRYPDTLAGGTYPGPIDFTAADVLAYSWPMSTRRLTAVEGLKALDCFEYQSCEHPEWTESEAYRFCDALRRSLVSKLAGYNEAAWSL